MKSRTLTFLLSAGVALSTVAPSMWTPPPTVDDSPLDEQMEIVRDSMNALRRSLRDEAKDAESLTSLGKLQAALIQSKSFEPRMTAKIPEENKAEFLGKYRKEMNHMIRLSLDLEDKLVDNSRDDIRGIFKKLRDMESRGHDQFTEDE